MDTLPRHVAIIMDGNGRWAAARGGLRTDGHRQGAEAVRRVVRAAREIGVRNLTLYAFSAQNWQRPAAEVVDLMRLLRRSEARTRPPAPLRAGGAGGADGPRYSPDDDRR